MSAYPLEVGTFAHHSKTDASCAVQERRGKSILICSCVDYVNQETEDDFGVCIDL